MAPRNTTESDTVANAPVVDPPADTGKTLTAAQLKAKQRADRKAELGKEVEAIFAAQFGGEDREPTEGTDRWDDMIREVVFDADKLETEYRAILTKKEANRTLLRAFSDMEKIPSQVADFYYPRYERGERG